MCCPRLGARPTFIERLGNYPPPRWSLLQWLWAIRPRCGDTRVPPFSGRLQYGWRTWVRVRLPSINFVWPVGGPRRRCSLAPGWPVIYWGGFLLYQAIAFFKRLTHVSLNAPNISVRALRLAAWRRRWWSSFTVHSRLVRMWLVLVALEAMEGSYAWSCLLRHSKVDPEWADW